MPLPRSYDPIRWLVAAALVAAAAVAGCGNDPLPFYAPDCIDDGCASGSCFRLAPTPAQTYSYCTVECNDHSDCPGGFCFELDGDPNHTKACFQSCGDDLDCDGGWLCEDAVDADSGATLGRICAPSGTAR